jgi:uncharacterized lipoprotein YddW (UPF0748 family)
MRGNFLKPLLCRSFALATLAVAQLASADIVLDDLTSGAAWSPSAYATAATTETADGHATLRFDCNYVVVPNGDRCYWSKSFSSSLDISSSNAISVRLKIDNAAAVNGINFYLELPSKDHNGVTVQKYQGVWYGYPKDGWQTVTIPFSTLLPSSCYTNAGVAFCPPLKEITSLSKLMFSPWKKSGSQTASKFNIASIRAVTVPVALLKSDSDGFTEVIRSILERYGIDFVEIPRTALSGSISNPLSPLRGTKVLIANNAGITATQATFLADYVDATSLKVVAYGPHLLFEGLSSLKGTLAATLGLNMPAGNSAHLQNVTAIANPCPLDSSNALGLPSTLPAVYDEVWTAYYHDSSATVTPKFACWINNGTATSYPAWLLNSKVAYRDKVLSNTYHPLDEDHALLAVMLELAPSLATDIVDGVIAANDRFATYGSFENAITSIRSAWTSAPAGPARSAALDSVDDAEELYDAALASSTTSALAIKGLFEARRVLGDAYTGLNLPSDVFEVKGIWENTGLGVAPGNWGQSISTVVANGFTHVVANVARAANVVYPSQYRCTSSQVTPTPAADGFPCMEWDSVWKAKAASDTDPLQSAITAAHQAGLKLFAWKMSFSWIGSKDHIGWWRNSDYAQVEYNSTTQLYEKSLNAPTPCSAAVRDRDYNIIDEIATNYAVDGIQLDFIRFNSVYGSYDNACRDGFASYLTDIGQTGLASSCVVDWPHETSRFSPGFDTNCAARFDTYKKKVVSDHVNRISLRISAINAALPAGKPPIELTAAVWPVNNESYAQDWPAWISAGWLDSAFPMTYAPSREVFSSEVLAAAQKVLNVSNTGTKKPLYFGLGGYQATTDDIVSQIAWLRSSYPYSAKGFSFFILSRDAVDNMLPKIYRAINFYDGDDDGIREDLDNCVATANPGQTDINDNDIGDACEHGLTVSYFNDSDTTAPSGIDQNDAKLVAPAVLQRIEPNVNFNYGIGYGPGSGVNMDYFSARFTGRLIVPAYTGVYTFCLKGDDGIRLWINNVNLLQNAYWRAMDSETGCGNMFLLAGQSVPIKVEFFDLLEDAIMELKWSWSGHAAEVIPSSSFYAQ